MWSILRPLRGKKNGKTEVTIGFIINNESTSDPDGLENYFTRGRKKIQENLTEARNS